MKKKFQILSIVVLLLASFTVANAQRGGDHHMNPEKKAEHMTTMLTEKLSLTEKQQAELKDLNSAFAEKMKAQREDRSREGMKALFEEHHAAIGKMLTGEQKEKFEALTAEHKGRMGRHGKHFRGNPEDRKAMHEDMRTYRQENILPVLLEQRAKLDSKISAADQKTITGLREKLAATRKEMAAKKEEKGKDFGPRHGHFRGRHMAMRTIMENEETRNQVEKLVETYSADMESLFAEISAQKEQWQNDRKAIHEKYHKDDNDAGGKRHWEGKEPDENRMAKRVFHRKLRFLLLEADANAPVGQNQAERKISVYPNPATTSQNIEFEVLTAGKVQVEIVDPQGNVVKSVFKGELPAGMNKLEVNTGELTGRLFYYRITDAQGMTSKPFFVRK